MTASLTPALALAWLRELSVDVRAAAVLDAQGALAAGDAGILASARELLAAGGGRRAQAGGTLLAARTPDGGAIAVLAGDFALAPLLEHDLATVSTALAGAPADPSET